MKKYFNTNFILESILILLCLISFIGAVVYRLYSLNNIGIIVALTLAAVIFLIIQKFRKIDKNSYTNQNIQKGKYPIVFRQIILLLYIATVAFCFYILFANQTAQAIISPWQVVPSYFFILYALATGLLILVIFAKHQLSLFLISIHYFLSFSIALIIYKLGYGFDPFIHQATVDLIDKTGSVEPKPFYYLGQYSLEIILHKITSLPIVWIDKLLVPLLAAVFLPFTINKVLFRWLKHKKTIPFLLVTALILPFSFFIVTTPQNLAYLLLILIILLSLVCLNIFDLNIVYLLALTAMLIQPIAGIPAFLFAIFLTIYYSDKEKIKKYAYALIFIISASAMPLAFYFIEKTNNIGAFNGTAQANIKNAISLPKLIMPSQENFILNFIYLYGFNLKIIFFLLVLTGMLIAYRYRKECRICLLHLAMATALVISYFLTKLLPFNFLIEYERSNYTDRILLLAALFLLPFIISALYSFVSKILQQNRISKIIIFIFLIILITTSLYLSYPRFDHYFNSHGYAVSASSLKVAQWIENNTANDYIVLANQQISAAALHEFGFNKYYKINYLDPSLYPEYSGEVADRPEGLIFYYPVPTGGPLYQYYLEMVYKQPSREVMNKAMALAGVKEAYFVLNKYWWAFPKILAEAKLEADSWQEFDQGEIYLFKYIR